METEIKHYAELEKQERDIVHRTYNNEWLMCHKKEVLGKIPKKLRKKPSEFKKELLRLCSEECAQQWDSASKIFPEGQNVLVKKEGGKREVAYHIRSVILYVPDFPLLSEHERSGAENYPADVWLNFKYPHTWYLVSDNGTLKESHKPRGNLWVNFAVTRNKDVELKGAGGLEKLLVYNLERARERDLCSHTFTPMNDYPFTPAPEVKEDEIERYIMRCFSGRINSPIGIHTYLMAKKKFGEKAKPKEDDPEILDFRRSRIAYIFPNGRIKRDAGDICATTLYTGPGVDDIEGWAVKYKQL